MKKYEYMVIYSDDLGLGRTRITTSKKIESYEDIQKIDEVLRKQNRHEPFVIDFKLLRVYEKKD